MWIFYASVILIVLFTSYYFGIPLYKKRPVLIKAGGLFGYFFVLAIALLQFLGMWTLIMGVLVILFLYFLKPWFIYGITSAMLSEALGKAALATRASIEKLGNKYKIDGSMEVSWFNLTEKISLVSYKKISNSKKTKLTIVVFKKFIQNYFI